MEIKSEEVKRIEFDRAVAKRLRASIILTGPLLARYGELAFPYPGGCVLGQRPIDLFLSSFKQMGAEVHEEKDGEELHVRWRVGHDAPDEAEGRDAGGQEASDSEAPDERHDPPDVEGEVEPGARPGFQVGGLRGAVVELQRVEAGFLEAEAYAA